MLWLYAIVEAGPLGGSGWFDGELRPGLRAVRCGDLAAVVEDLARPHALEPESLRMHDGRVRSLAARVPALLPARFGQTAADDAALTRNLAEAKGQLAAALDHVRGCVQVTVRIDGDEAILAGAEPATTGVGGGPGRQYLQRRFVHHRMAGLDELRRYVEPWVRETRVRRGPKPVLASAYHLVACETSDRLIAAVREFEPPWDLRLQVSEPQPAYAFATPPKAFAS